MTSKLEYQNVTKLRNKAESIMLEPPQSPTIAWVDIGRMLYVQGLGSLAFWIDVAMNDSRNLRFRVQAVPAPESINRFDIPIQTVQSDVVEIDTEFFEFQQDVDQKILFQSSLGNLVPYVQLQVQAGTVGAIPAVINDILVSINAGDV